MDEQRNILSEVARLVGARCCKYDHDGDGNCHIHEAPGVPRIHPDMRASLQRRP